MRYATLLLAAASAATLALNMIAPASANMPSPNFANWPDHTKTIRLGSDIPNTSQHYATFTVTPKGNGKFSIDLRAENGQRGSKTDGTFILTFLAGDREIKTVSQYVRIDRQELTLRHQVTEVHLDDVDLGSDEPSITRIRVDAVGRWTPPERRQPPPPVVISVTVPDAFGK
ncbi:hypothetical protein ACQR10_27360 [Bradyrhizobium sp. HKCCYLRH2060]|uniref:hypothetical protein n=1 Tax=Bradyrhizobium TaxID=374 RepID=UPI002915D62B|nr:hypothetical protein [Bradyrhizobium sp. SZCCHNR3003]